MANETGLDIKNVKIVLFPDATESDIDQKIRKRLKLEAKNRKPLAGVLILTTKQIPDGLVTDGHVIANGRESFENLFDALVDIEKKLALKMI